MDRSQLFAATIVPSLQTGGRALIELLDEGKIQRTGKGIRSDPYRYLKLQRGDIGYTPDSRHKEAKTNESRYSAILCLRAQ